MIGLIRRFSLPLLLVLAVVVPYAMYGDSTGTLRQKFQSLLGGSTEKLEPIEGISDPAVSRLLALQQKYAASDEKVAAGTRLTPTINLEGVLRFDVSPRWVLDSWPRVSTTRIDGPLDGLRVPLVTGTGPLDVVGSLTYYFDQYQQVQRIALDGVVGDDRQMVSIVTRVFQLQPEPTAGTGVFLAKWNGKPFSALLIRRMPVVSADHPLQKFSFTLELNRPSNYFGLSPQLQNELQRTHATRAGLGSVY
jgi:hypothetical protein